MATSIPDIFRKLTRMTNSNSYKWISIVDGMANTIMGEEIIVSPSINTIDRTYHSYVKLNNSNLVLNSFNAKIISAGQDIQRVSQVSGSPNLILNDTGNSAIKVTVAKIDTTQGSLTLKWTGTNIWTERYLEDNGFGASRGEPINENAHKLIASYQYIKKDSNIGSLSQVYSYGNTPWNKIGETGKGCVVINSPRNSNSMIKTLKFIAYDALAIDWISEPENGTVDQKELTNLFDAITKQVADDFANFIGL